MKSTNSFSIKNRIRSFSFALQGIKSLFRTEHNAWIHFASALVAITLGVYFSLSNTEWCLLLLAIALVFVTEILNTSLEKLTDLVAPTYNETAKRVKDLAAGAVLIAAIIALAIGCFLFFPKI